jgi:hypothetical protein
LPIWFYAIIVYIYISPFKKPLHHLKTKTQTDRAGPSPSWNSPAELWRRSENPMGPWQLFGHLQWEISMENPKRKWMINEDSNGIYISIYIYILYIYIYKAYHTLKIFKILKTVKYLNIGK